MATPTYLSSPVVTVNSVSLSAFCTSATVTNTREAIDTTSFGDTSRVSSPGLGNPEVTLSLYLTYAATETYATLKSLVGTRTTVTVKATSAANSATNPLHQVVGCYLESLPVLDTTVGEMQQIDIVFTGGVYTEVIV